MSDTEKLVIEIPRKKGNGEVIRASLSTFKGNEMFSLRIWFKDGESGEMRPGKNGINLPRSEFPELERAVLELRKALAETNIREPANA
jgi:hypothetical protein